MTTKALPDLPELTVDHAELWVAAALAEARALRQYDEQVYPADRDPAAMRTAKLLHAAWARWADHAESLLACIRSFPRRHVAGMHDLEYELLRARGVLHFSPETMLAREEQVRRGEVLTPEEVRRELRLANRR